MADFTVYKGSPNGRILKSTARKTPGPDEVLIQITHSGVCGTDVHYKSNDMVLGHEGVGIVKEVGSQVTDFKTGQRAGFGYLHSTCGHCKQCLRGAETFCPSRHIYGSAELDQGSFASFAVWKADYLFAVPDEIASEHAAPLMCGGATVFNALQFHGAKSTDRVGVVGVGGLGHIAIQFASKMGCEVVVFSGTDSKKAEAMRLGAKEFYATKGAQKLDVTGGQIDHLLVTASQQPDWSMYLPIMAPSGTIYPLTVSGQDLNIPPMKLTMAGLKLQGSLVAPRRIHREMLHFAAFHGIKPIIETFDMNEEGIAKAFERLEDGNMRYRGVLVAPKLD